MKKLSVFSILLLAAILSLFSCNKNNSAPAGMKPAGGSDELGFYLYVPSEWTVSGYGDVVGAHISTVDTTTVTLAEIKAPDSAALTGEALKSYYKADIQNLKFDDMKFTADGEECLLGNADKAYKFVFEFTYGGVKQKQMQIITSYKGHVYLFTYQSRGELMSKDKTYFDYHYELVQSIMKEIKFTEQKTAEQKKPSDPDGDGYYLASSKRISGFELYAPVSAKCEYSAGMVSVKLSEGANASMTKTALENITVQNYLEQRKKEITSFAQEFTDISVKVKRVTDKQLEDFKAGFTSIDKELISSDESLTLGELDQAFLYEYSYKYKDTVYYVYQILGISGYSGYVFTYTAAGADEYDAHLGEVNEILSRVKF